MAGAQDARLCRPRDGAQALRAGRPSASRRSALHLCRPPVDRARRGPAPRARRARVDRRGAARARRPARLAPLGGGPPDGAVRRGDRAARGRPRSACARHAAGGRARPADDRGGRRRLGGGAAHRPGRGGEIRGTAQGAGRACGLGHGDARARAFRRADGGRLQGLEARGEPALPPHRRHDRARQSRARGEGDPRIRAGRGHGRASRRSARAPVRRHARAPGAGGGLRAHRRRHGSRWRDPERGRCTDRAGDACGPDIRGGKAAPHRRLDRKPRGPRHAGAPRALHPGRPRRSMCHRDNRGLDFCDEMVYM